MRGVESYAIGEKCLHRRWIWNRLTDLLTSSSVKGHRRAACASKLGVYLVGPHDEDWEEAKRNGFRRENMIAVDISGENVSHARSNGAIAVTANIVEVLYGWPANLPLDFVYADLCGGMTEDTRRLIMALLNCRGAHPGTVLGVNLQRGRSEYFSLAQRTAHEEICRMWKECGMIDSHRHRGMFFYNQYWRTFADWLAGACGGKSEKYITDMHVTCAMQPIRQRRVHVSSYQSHRGSLRFDSVVFKCRPRLRSANGTEYDLNSVVERMSEGYALANCKHDRLQRIRRRLAAMRAIRTMRTRRVS